MAEVTPIVYVVDDDVSVREALEALIQEAGWQPRVFASAQEFLAHSRSFSPSCLVLDIGLPDLNGLDLQQQVMGDRNDIPIIFITGCADIRASVRAMKAGAIEFLIKPFSDQDLLDTIQGAVVQSAAALVRDTEQRRLENCHETLSTREREVMALVVTGLLNKQIAGELGISEITVKAHRGRVMRKMEATSFADLVNISARLGIQSRG
jgi:FixJ family two-component response regulator